MATIVRFVKSENGDITAVFPGRKENIKGKPIGLSCYSHVGQHSVCSPEWVNEQEQASENEYAPLKRELEGPVGYELKVSNAKSKL